MENNKKEEKLTLTTTEELIEKTYGKIGTSKRDEFDKEYQLRLIKELNNKNEEQ